MQRLRPVPTSHQNKLNIFVYPDLKMISHVFVRKDYVLKPLEQPYDGPYPVEERKEKHFSVTIKGRDTNFSINRLKKLTFLFNDTDLNNDLLFHVTKSGRKVSFLLSPKNLV